MQTRQTRHWRNWSNSVRCTPQQIERPRTIDELAQLISNYQRSGRQVRVVGSGHSFTPLVQTNDVLLSLEQLQGIEEIDTERQTVTVLGGTTLKRLGAELHAHGLAQEDLGDIDVQSIAGAVSTGTHGTGIQFGSLSTQIAGLTLVTANGELLECSPTQHADTFKAAQVSLGALGVIAKVTLRVVPAKRLHARVHREQLSTCIDNLERYKQENSHFEFYWFPYTEWTQVKFLNETTAAPNAGSVWSTFNKVVLENGVYWLLSEGNRLFPTLSPTVSKISAMGVASVDEVDHSQHIFSTLRVVRFEEMEYNVPAEHFSTVLTEIRECIARERIQVHFPIECRFVHEDDIWLSPAYQRASAYIAVHMYKGMPYQSYFQHIEAIFQRYQGRPHWGKRHTQNAQQLATLYPRWHDFQRIRAELDPQGMFLNAYLRQLLDAAPPTSNDSTLPSQQNQLHRT